MRAYTTARRAIISDVDVTSDTAPPIWPRPSRSPAPPPSSAPPSPRSAQVRAYLDGSRDAGGRGWGRCGIACRRGRATHRAVSSSSSAPPEERFAHWDDTPFAAARSGRCTPPRTPTAAASRSRCSIPAVAESLRDDLVVGVAAPPRRRRRARRRRRRRGAGGHARAAPRRARLRRRGALARALRPRLCRRRAIVVPRVDAARSTARVLTMERLDGRALARLAERRRAATRRRRRHPLPLRLRRAAAARHLQRRSAPGQLPRPRRRTVGFVDFGSAAELSPSSAHRRSPALPRR